MCVELPGRVVSIDETGATVDRDGVRRRASTLLVPGLVPGDWVLVGAGHVLRVIPEAEARSIVDTIHAAAGAVSAAPPGVAPGPGGSQP